MKKNIFSNKKFRYGSVSVALVVVIVAAVILVNAIFSSLAYKNLWFIDMTADRMWTLSDAAGELIDTVDPNAIVTVTFCTERDTLETSEMYSIPHQTVLDIQARLGKNENGEQRINVRYVDIYTNPSAVAGAESTTAKTITTSTIILESGGEYRVYDVEDMYVSDDSGNVNGYRGEQVFVAGILAITKTEQPVAYFTSNHGEMDEKDAARMTSVNNLKQVMREAGCKVEDLDLARDPEADTKLAEARFVVVVDPQSDFLAGNDALVGENYDEIRRLEKFLSDQKSLMVFFDNATPYLPNFETFLQSWGIAIARDAEYNNSALLVYDQAQSLDLAGLTNIGDYVTEGGLGASLTKKLWNTANPKSVVFPYAAVMYTAPTFNAQYNENGFWEASYFANGRQRNVVDVFTSSNTAYAKIGDTNALTNKQLEESYGLNVNADVPFSYMKLAYETQQNDVYSYVLACSSVDFALATTNSGYGNHTVLSYATSQLGRDAVAVSIDTKYFSDTEISNITATEANVYTVVLTVVPTIAILAAGVVVIIRRRFS